MRREAHAMKDGIKRERERERERGRRDNAEMF